MTKEIKYKLQGDGRDSWEVKEYDDDGNKVAAYMVYEDPNLPPSPPKIDLISIMQNSTPEERAFIKQILQ